MDISRRTRGKIELKTQAVDIGPIIERAVNSVSALVRTREHDLSVELGHGDARVEVDPTRLEQVVANLLSNATKYSGDRATIRLRTSADAGGLRIAVEDTGVGIPADQLPKMFDLFVQGDQSMARSEGGLGIGLTLVRRLVEMHRGSVTAESEGVGRGSTFTVRIPTTGAEPDVLAATKQEQPAPAAVKKRILVVDDNDDTRIGLSRLLKLRGHEVQTAGDGEEALAVADLFAPDYILMDIGLPVLNGYEVAARLRALDSCKGAVIVAISGYGQERDRERSTESGFDHHLIKPVDYERLLMILAGAI